ncbi:MAG: NAD(P)H-dependent glycerol-3-phosphate dehydrogenase [Alphaproteobacteria bacterium]|nr:NAD(P)H-dependent glycerol-3-phosphate dehydrogenase [Alphaproteobacteria bacterium]
MQAMRIRAAILGGGSWGTTVASLVARNVPAIIWARSAETVDEINTKNANERYLPGARLTPALRATTSIEEAVRDADVVIMGVPSQAMRETAREVGRHIRAWVPLISLSKGLELGTKLRMTQVIEQELPGHPAGVLSGPNLAREVMSGYAAASAIAMEDEVIVQELQSIFKTGLFRVYTNTDVAGCELGGALKNVMAIAAGMGDGAGAGENTRSAVISRALNEITRLGVAMGGRTETFAGLAGIGDLIATCTSPQSRNRTVGFELGRGRKIADILAGMRQVAEGVKSAKTVLQLAEEHGVEMPIASEVNGVINEGRTAQEAFRGLLKRAAGSEADPG